MFKKVKLPKIYAGLSKMSPRWRHFCCIIQAGL